MEKLIELLNEYDGTPTEWKQIGDKIYFDGLGGNSELHELIIISKYYGFIKWLVDNDKIDFNKIPNKIKEIGIPMLWQGEIKYGFDSSDYYWLLMLLSIQENSIEFLISILK